MEVNLVTITLTCLLLFMIVYVADWLFLIIEESQLVTLRAKIPVMLLVSLALLGLVQYYIDPMRHHNFRFTTGDYEGEINFNYYYITVFFIAVLALGRYIMFSTWTDKVAILLLGVFFALFVGGLLGKEWYAFGFLYMACMYYAVFVVGFLEKNALLRVLYIAASAVVMVAVALSVDMVRYEGMYVSYVLLLYCMALLTRYLWNLEFKRRTRCSVCSGWGKTNEPNEKTPWWAVGFKKTVHSKGCTNCQGRGWTYIPERADNYWHS